MLKGLTQDNKVKLAIAIIAGMFGLVAGLIVNNSPNSDPHTPAITAKNTCHNLLGEYALNDKEQYIFTSEDFTNKDRIRATAIGATWEKLRCEPSGDTYELIGRDTTRHLLEYKLDNGDFKHIGFGTSSYDSKVVILKNRTFGVRRIISKDSESDISYVKPEYKEKYKNAFDAYDNYRRNVHHYHVTSGADKKIPDAGRRSTPCLTLFGEDNFETVLAFACNNYTRTMKRVAK